MRPAAVKLCYVAVHLVYAVGRECFLAVAAVGFKMALQNFLYARVGYPLYLFLASSALVILLNSVTRSLPKRVAK